MPTMREKLAAWWRRNKTKARQAEKAYNAENKNKLASGNWERNKQGKIVPKWST